MLGYVIEQPCLAIYMCDTVTFVKSNNYVLVDIYVISSFMQDYPFGTVV